MSTFHGDKKKMNDSKYMPSDAAIADIRTKLAIFSHDDLDIHLAQSVRPKHSDIETFLKTLPDQKSHDSRVSFSWFNPATLRNVRSKALVTHPMFVPSAANLKKMMGAAGYELRFDEVRKRAALYTPANPTHPITDEETIAEQIATLLNKLYDSDFDLPVRHVDPVGVTTMVNVPIKLEFSKDEMLRNLNAITFHNPLNQFRDMFVAEPTSPVTDEWFEYAINGMATDHKMARTLLTRWLVSVVAAQCHGTKWALDQPHAQKLRTGFEGVLILQGGQAAGKTSWIKGMFPLEHNDWGGTIKLAGDKDSLIQSLSYVVAEIGEFETIYKSSSIEEFKTHTTKTEDKIRFPYTKAFIEYLRRTIYYATANSKDLLQDEENRRMWILPINKIIDPRLNKPKILPVNSDWGWIEDHREWGPVAAPDADERVRKLWQYVYRELYLKGVPWWLGEAEKEQLEIANRDYHSQNGYEPSCEQHVCTPEEAPNEKVERLNPQSIISRLRGIKGWVDNAPPLPVETKAVGRWLRRMKFTPTNSAGTHYLVVIRENVRTEYYESQERNSNKPLQDMLTKVQTVAKPVSPVINITPAIEDSDDIKCMVAEQFTPAQRMVAQSDLASDVFNIERQKAWDLGVSPDLYNTSGEE